MAGGSKLLTRPRNVAGSRNACEFSSVASNELINDQARLTVFSSAVIAAVSSLGTGESWTIPTSKERAVESAALSREDNKILNAAEFNSPVIANNSLGLSLLANIAGPLFEKMHPAGRTR